MSSSSSSSPSKHPRNSIIYIEYINCFAAITTYNLQTKIYRQSTVPFECFQILHFLRSTSSINLCHVKAIIFILNESLFASYLAGYNFRQKCYEFCVSHGIFYLFIPPNIIQSSMALSQTQTAINEGEEVLIISATAQGYLNGVKILRQLYHYRIKSEQQTQNIIIGDPNLKLAVLGIPPLPRKIILVRQTTDPYGLMDNLWRYFLKDNAIILAPDITIWQKAIVDTVLHLMGETVNSYIVGAPCKSNFIVCNGNVILFKNLPENLPPFEKTAIVDVDPAKYISLIAKTSSPAAVDELIQDINLSTFKSKQVKVILKVDSNSFYDFKVEEIDDEKVPKTYFLSFDSDKQQEQQPSAKSIIRFTQDEYYFVLQNGINDAERIPIYISFAEKIPIFGDAAKEMCIERPDCVVYDIIKLCSYSSSLIFVNPKWNFSLSKSDDAATTMVTVKTVDGERQASPDFLLALVLKDAINKIQQQIKTKLDEIIIGFDGFIPNKFLKKSFQEAAKRLKIEIDFC